MTVGLGAAGVLGLGFEALATPGTPVAATKFVPIESETLKFSPPINKRRPIQGTADVVGIKVGKGFVEGDVTFAAFHDVLPYFLYAARTTAVKTGVATPWEYAFTGAHTAEAPYTLSLVVERNGIVFVYAGCVASKFSFSVTEDVLMVTVSIIGRTEATGAAPTENYGSVGNEFGAGTQSVEFADTVITAIDEVTIDIDDAGTAQMRTTTSLGADLVTYGERSIAVSLSSDFENRTEYDLFRAGTTQKFEYIADDGTHSLIFEAPAAAIDSYDVGLAGQGELVRATVAYMGVHDDVAGAGYTLTITTDEDITVPV